MQWKALKLVFIIQLQDIFTIYKGVIYISPISIISVNLILRRVETWAPLSILFHTPPLKLFRWFFALPPLFTITSALLFDFHHLRLFPPSPFTTSVALSSTDARSLGRCVVYSVVDSHVVWNATRLTHENHRGQHSFFHHGHDTID